MSVRPSFVPFESTAQRWPPPQTLPNTLSPGHMEGGGCQTEGLELTANISNGKGVGVEGGWGGARELLIAR